MSIKYELSLWQEFPGSTGIQEEKTNIIAATGMLNAGRAQNIKLKKEYNGKQTLEFEIPVKYSEATSGKQVENDLVNLVLDHSKIKLWRDEKWWNPFANNKGKDKETGCTIFEGAWTQGRWYEFIVVNRTQKRSKKQLVYSYTCDSLFMNELSRTGYNLEFVPDTDVMSANGMGTAHDLAARIVDGTDWQYMKTEVFPDYKEEFNPTTGETVRVPVSTDQIEFATGLERYVYCYTLTVNDDGEKEEILNEIGTLAKEQNLSISKNVHYGFDKDKFWWRPTSSDDKKEYIYGYNKTSIITSYSDKVLCYTDGRITKDRDGEQKVDEGTLLSSTNLWEGMNGVNVDVTCINEGGPETIYYYLNLGDTTGKANKPIICNSGYSNKRLEKGEHLVLSLNTHGNGKNVPCRIYIYDGNPITEPKNPVQTEDFTSNGSTNCFPYSYILTLRQTVQNPYFAFGYRTDQTNKNTLTRIDGLFMYKFVGANEKIDSSIKEWIAKQSGYCNRIANLSAPYNSISGVTDIDLVYNTCTIDGQKTCFWLPVGSMAQNNFKNGVDVFCIEFSRSGEYFDIYPTIEKEDTAKITSFDKDKRRSISGSKSNRYSLLETISKTFFCFTRFVVEHDEQGYIKTDEYGRPIKRFTFASEMGRRNFNGFNYGVNLEGVERKLDSTQLVTKVYVEPIDNQYDDSGVITIQNSKYNKMGERFVYNFAYFARQGFLKNDQFMLDYKETYDFVGLKNAQAKELNEKYIAREQYRQTKQTAYDTHVMQLSAVKKEANEALDLLKWDRFTNYVLEKHNNKVLTKEDFIFPNIDFSLIVTSIINTAKGYSRENGENDYEFIARFANNTRVKNTYDQSEAWLSNGEDPANIAASLEAIGEKQLYYKNLDATTTAEKTALEVSENGGPSINEDVKTLLDSYNDTLKQKDKKLQWFEKKYHRFILEGTWSGQDYIEPDTYYLDATRAMSVSCMPKVSYNMNVVDLSQLCNPQDPTDETWGEDFIFDVGDTTYIRDKELFGNIEQKSMIAEITSHVDLDKPDDLSLRNFETRFEELFQSIAAAVTTLQLNENIYGRAANFSPDGIIDTTILQKSFAANRNLVISSANNLVTQDNRGLTISTDDNSGQVLRAIAGGIFLSNDNGQTFTAGITPSGINASLITAGQIDTSKIVIRSTETPQYVLDGLGLTAYSIAVKNSGDTTIRDNSIVRFDQFGIYATENGTLFGRNWSNNMPNNYSSFEDYISDNSIFSLTRKGLIINSNGVSGSIKLSTATSHISVNVKNGTTESARVKLGYLRSGVYGLEVYDGALTIWDTPCTINPNGETSYGGAQKLLWTEKVSGSLVLKIKGEINATTGKIGGDTGWTIAANKLTSGTIGDTGSIHLYTYFSGSATIGGKTSSNWRLTIGKNFGVENDGTLNASNANIKGRIEAKEGLIGNMLIDGNGIYSNGSGGGVGMWKSGSHYSGGYIAFHAGASSESIASAPFKVYHNGKVVASNIVIGGTSTIAGWTITNDTIKSSNGKTVLTSTNGAITSTQGSIGGWNLGEQKINTQSGLVTVNTGLSGDTTTDNKYVETRVCLTPEGVWLWGRDKYDDSAWDDFKTWYEIFYNK